MINFENVNKLMDALNVHFTFQISETREFNELDLFALSELVNPEIMLNILNRETLESDKMEALEYIASNWNVEFTENISAEELQAELLDVLDYEALNLDLIKYFGGGVGSYLTESARQDVKIILDNITASDCQDLL